MTFRENWGNTEGWAGLGLGSCSGRVDLGTSGSARTSCGTAWVLPGLVTLWTMVAGGLLLCSGPGSRLWAPQTVVLLKWAFHSRSSSWLGSCSSLPDILVTVCRLPVLLALGIPLLCVSGSKCLWNECFRNILLLLPATEINATVWLYPISDSLTRVQRK